MCIIKRDGGSRSEAGMTTEPSDAETCLHDSISEANKSSPVRGMTCKGDNATAPIVHGQHLKEIHSKKRPIIM